MGRFATQAVIQIGRIYGAAGKEVATDTIPLLNTADEALAELADTLNATELTAQERKTIKDAVKNVSKAIGEAKITLSQDYAAFGKNAVRLRNNYARAANAASLPSDQIPIDKKSPKLSQKQGLELEPFGVAMEKGSKDVCRLLADQTHFEVEMLRK